MTIPPETLFLSAPECHYAAEGKLLTDAGAMLLGFLDNKARAHVYPSLGRAEGCRQTIWL
jgi:hypothetical protein